ncbi:hypothetical protein [Kineosporia babensis]|uniref:Uncharacterized protein n=1 Tax=Kineosporia babensis TaxID=499548 RepID=A0A9X1NAU5_9ACTN|nr:hypothetical protein [Kineosporia babensis]MCD5311792.1 hypothetical protein [Kineosporia babensis]
MILLVVLLGVWLGYLSLWKGWWVFFLIPALLPVMAIEIGTQAAALTALRVHGEPPRMSRRMAALIEVLAAAQLVAVAGTYLCFPALADTTDSSAFTFIWADMDTFIVKLSWALTVVSGVAAVGVTVALLILLAVLRGRSSSWS